MLVIGMNRLRGAYVQIDLWVKDHLVRQRCQHHRGRRPRRSASERRRGW